MARDFVTEPSPSAEPKVSAANAASVSSRGHEAGEKAARAALAQRETGRSTPLPDTHPQTAGGKDGR